MTVYLSPEQPRWSPRTEADLKAAIDDGLFDESHRLEAKTFVERGKGANRELARDLASFAIDGGTIVIGVKENKDAGTFDLAAQKLSGLVERIESVAYSIPDPPLSLVISTIAADVGDGSGYLVVNVPASPLAPHMVDGRYLGRGEKQKRYLTDAEVARLHAQRRQADVDLLSLLDAEIARDPAPEGTHAHLFLVAEPLAPRPDMLLPLLDGNGWQQRLLNIVNAATCVEELGQKVQFSPGIGMAIYQHRRRAGAAVSTAGVLADRTLNAEAYDPEGSLDIEIHYDGAVRVFMGRLSDTLEKGTVAIFEVAPLVFTRQLVKLVTLIAEQSGYLGSWGLGLAATNLRGRPAYTHVSNWLSSSSYSYDRDEEKRVTVATYPELMHHPGAVTDRLVGHFLRVYGLHERHADLLTDPEPADLDEDD